MRRAPLLAMLTILGTLAATVTLAACGGKSSPSKSTTTSTAPEHKHKTKPGY